MKIAVFCDVEPCRYCVNRRFGGTAVQDFLFSPQRPDLAWEPPPPSFSSSECRGSFPGKRQQREAEHLPPSSSEVKNDGAMPPLYHIFMAYCSTK
jgi:hypothetical protein